MRFKIYRARDGEGCRAGWKLPQGLKEWLGTQRGSTVRVGQTVFELVAGQWFITASNPLENRCTVVVIPDL